MSLAGYPIRVVELLATLRTPAYLARVSVDEPKAIMNAKKAIRKAFKFQIDKTCFSLIEVVSTCPTGWGQQPHEACEWLEEHMLPYFPLGDVKTLQPLETGVVSGIRVKEGDYVARGATLLEVDPALDTADLEGKEKNLRFSRAAAQRSDAVLAGRAFRPDGDTEPELARAQRRLYETQAALYRSTLGEKEKGLREAEATLKGVTEERSRLEGVHRIVTEEEKRQKSLVLWSMA